MCSSPATALSWVGGILINVAFISLITWGGAMLWLFGLFLCAVYATCLGVSWHCLRKREDVPQVALDLLMMMCVLGACACGMIISLNAIGCRAVVGLGYDPNMDSSTWIFPPAATESTAVRAWALNATRTSGASFAHASGVGTLFAANDGALANSYDDIVHLAPSSGAAPSRVASAASLTQPDFFVNVGGRVCLTARVAAPTASCATCTASCVACLAADVTSAPSIVHRADLSNPRDLLVDASTGTPTLWFKDNAPFGASPDAGVVYRADATLSSAALASTSSNGATAPPPPPPGMSDPCPDREGSNRWQAFGFLMLATLPLLVASALLWWKLRVASTLFGIYLGTSALCVTIYVLSAPRAEHVGTLLRWWFPFFSGLWLLGFGALGVLRRLDVGPLKWAINVGCIGYFGGVHALVEVPFVWDEAWRWVVYTLVLVAPLMLLAVVQRAASWLPLALSCGGLLLDIFRLADLITDLVPDETARALIRFVMLGAGGVGVVFGGWWYNKNSSMITAEAERLVTSCGCCARLRREAEEDGNASETPAVKTVSA